ncbi:Negative regulator of mitotic exit [Steccherinum ochraceum]|uniref:Negative regulator of mitotic exit n=1 Tax=Steccherinum ochraceum TaxID=92696 RepID=A0A4R0R870_9APHY|nr:Negative regulator of mitotic exit [Steccherinum ochraceum]
MSAATKKPKSKVQEPPHVTERRQRIQPPPQYKEVVWPWSSHALVLEPPESLPTPNVRPSIAPSPSPFPRYSHTLSPTATDDGDLILFGGLVDGVSSNDVYAISVRDGRTRLIETTGDIPDPRFGHASIIIGSMVLIWGGDTRNAKNAHERVVLDNSLYCLDLVQRHWHRIPVVGNVPDGRYGHAMCAVDEVIYIFGGQLDGTFMNDIWALDLSFPQSPLHKSERLLSGYLDFSGTMKDPMWDPIVSKTQAPVKRTNHIWVPFERCIYLFGGTDGEYHYNDTWEFDVKTRQWSEITALGFVPTPREGHAAAIVEDMIYIYGGRAVDGKDLGDMGSFRVSQKRWFKFRNMGPEPSPRSGHAMAAVNSTAYVLGGLNYSADPSDEASVIHALETSNLKYPSLTSPLQGTGWNPE